MFALLNALMFLWSRKDDVSRVLTTFEQAATGLDKIVQKRAVAVEKIDVAKQRLDQKQTEHETQIERAATAARRIRELLG